MAFFGNHRLKAFFNIGARAFMGRQKHHADAIMAFFGQRETVGCHFAKKCVGHLNQHADAVTSFRVSTDRAAMLQIFQYRQTVVDNVMAFDIFDIGDKANAASVMFIGRVIKPLAGGKPVALCRFVVLPLVIHAFSVRLRHCYAFRPCLPHHAFRLTGNRLGSFSYAC